MWLQSLSKNAQKMARNQGRYTIVPLLIENFIIQSWFDHNKVPKGCPKKLFFSLQIYFAGSICKLKFLQLETVDKAMRLSILPI